MIRGLHSSPSSHCDSDYRLPLYSEQSIAIISSSFSNTLALDTTHRFFRSTITALTHFRQAGRMTSNIASSSSSSSNSSNSNVSGAIRLPRRAISTASQSQSLSHNVGSSASTKNVVVLGGSYGGKQKTCCIIKRSLLTSLISRT